MNVLDSIIANHDTGPQILAEQHDVGQIDWVRGLSDPGEMIACGYMPQARRLDNETDDAYAHRLRTTLTPEQYAELQAACRPAAIRRAALDTSTGKVAVMVAGAAPWHKLGVNVAAAVGSKDAIRLASLNWQVQKEALAYAHPATDAMTLQDIAYAIVRNDTGDCLGVVGNKYKPIQNEDAFDFLDSVVSEFGARYETAGAVFGGKRVWMLVHLPNQRVDLGGGDVVEPYALFVNPHDGSGCAACLPTTERVVCANTLRVALGKDKHKGIRLRHTGNLKARIQDAKKALSISVNAFGKFAEAATVMTATPLPSVKQYANGVLDAVLEVTEAQSLLGADVLAAAIAATEAEQDLRRKQFAKQIEHRQSVLDDILNRYDSERCGTGGMRGTVWAGLNAVTEHADHANGKRKVGTVEAQLSRKMVNVLVGDADDMKQVAYQKALEYLPA